MSRLFKVFALWVLVFSLTACISIDQTNTWRDPHFTSAPFNSMLVSVAEDSETNRRVMEDSIIQSLLVDGVTATSSYTQHPNLSAAQIIPPESLPALQLAAKQVGAASILILRTLHVDQRIQRAEPSYGMGYGWGGSRGWGGFGSWGGPVIHDYTVISLEVTLWSQQTGKLVWSSTYSLVDPQNTPKLAQKLSAQIADQLRKEGLI